MLAQTAVTHELKEKTLDAGHFWPGCASAVKWGLERVGFILIEADAETGVLL